MTMDFPASPSLAPAYGSYGQPLVHLIQDFERFPAFIEQSPKKAATSPTSDKGSGSTTDGASGADCTMEYLAGLLKEKKQLNIFPQVFHHIERLVDEEISRVRMALFQCRFSTGDLNLPEPEGEPVVVQEKAYVPCNEHPDYNFVGRILGPRGMTAKQLEQETGCKIMVRGRGSMRDRKKEEMNRGKPNWEHLNDGLHVLVQCEDTPNRVHIKMKAAIEEIKKLLVPAPEGADELKRKQLMELALINGTYRPASGKYPPDPPRLLAPVALVSPVAHHSGSLPPQSIFVSPTGNSIPINGATSIANLNASPGSSILSSPNVDYNMVMNQLSFEATLASFPMMADYQGNSSPFQISPSLFKTNTSSNSGFQSIFVDSSLMPPPASADSN